MKKATLSLALLALTLQAHAASPYSVKTQYPIAGTEGWDYLTVDSEARRLYVSHSVRVEVLNADTGAQIRKIEDTPGVHGIAIAHKLNHGFTSNGKENTVSMFDLKTLALIKKIPVGQGPNGIFFDAASKHVFTDNHGSHDITVLDAETGNVVGTVAIAGTGTGMAFGKDGLAYVVVKDKPEIAVFDPVKLDVKRHIPLPGLQSPSDLAMDKATHRLFVGGHNKTMLVVDAESGKVIANLPTAAGTDGAAFNKKDHRIFISNGEGNITVIAEKSPNEFVAEDPIVTAPGAKTIAFDGKTGRLFLPSGTSVVTPASEPGQKPKKSIKEGSFGVLVVGQ